MIENIHHLIKLIIYRSEMELANNATHIFNEGIAFRKMSSQGLRISTRCLQLNDALSRCVVNNKLNVLDGECKIDVS